MILTNEVMDLRSEVNTAKKQSLMDRDCFQKKVNELQIEITQRERKDSQERAKQYREELEKKRIEQMKREIKQKIEFEDMTFYPKGEGRGNLPQMFCEQ